MTSKFFYPVTEETFRKYATDIFSPIKRGECATTVWVTMAGRRMWNKFLIENINLFEKELPNYQKYILVYIEPLDLTEESLSGYIRLMAKSLIEACEKHPKANSVLVPDKTRVFDQDGVSYSTLLDSLKALLKELVTTGHDIVFFIGEFDELTFANKIFYNNLKSLWSGLYPRLHYVFLMRERVTRAQNIAQWGELNEAILQNMVYVPLLTDKDFNYQLDYYESEYSTDFDIETRKILGRVCGGHPYLLKASVRIMNNPDIDRSKDLESQLVNHYELRSVAKSILDVRSENEKEVLKMIATETPLRLSDGEIVKFLQGLGVVRSDKNGANTVFSEILKSLLVEDEKKTETDKGNNNGNLVFDEATGRILLSGRGIEDKLTRQEYLILSIFLKESGKLFSRDEVGLILWGKQSYEKFSDWAIDQLISKLRKKLKNMGTKTSVSTVRGRGYVLSAS